MKILHVTPAYFPAYSYGGPIPVLHELCLQTVNQGHQVRVLTTDSHGLGQKLGVPVGKEIEIEELLRVRYCRRIARHSISLDLIRLLPEYVRWADIVHLTSVYNFPVLPALAVCNHLNKPILWSPHGALQRWEGSRRTRLKAIWEKICRSIAPTTVMLHTSSKTEAAESTEHFPGFRTTVIPWGVTVPSEIQKTKSDGILRLLYLGRLDEKKGLENLIDACRILAESRRVQWNLTIAGNGPSGYTQALRENVRNCGLLACEEGAPKTIRMIGEVTQREKERLFSNCDVLILPSYTENFSVVVGEALAREIPVIASTGTPWNELQEIGCGLYVANDSRSLAKAIETIAQLPLGDMGRRGRKWIQQQFRWEEIAERMLTCYYHLQERIQ